MVCLLVSTCGKGSAEASRTFSGFRSQWTMFLKWRCLRAARIFSPTITQSAGDAEETQLCLIISPKMVSKWQITHQECTTTMSCLIQQKIYKKILSFLWFTHLSNEEFSESFRQSAFFTGEDHLQHVAVQLLHHHKHSLWGFKHALQVHNAQVT